MAQAPYARNVGVVYVNGKLVDPSEAVISVFDHGLLVGDGVFESVVVRNGRPFALSRHLQRLQASAAVLMLPCPSIEELSEAVAKVAAASGHETAKIRITVTSGTGELGSARTGGRPTLIIACEELRSTYAPRSVVVAPWPHNERSSVVGAKTISYAENVVALAYAAKHGADEALLLNRSGNLSEGTGTNVFVGIDGHLVTPPLSAGCLAGVTRGLVLEVVEVKEDDVSWADLERVTEAFLTSTTRGVEPISSIDGRQLVCPGPLTEKAAAGFAEIQMAGLL
jgi:branched-chain amino acid aminotransferase